jgi:glycosyltransferase involved in cell wall biosynthesis
MISLCITTYNRTQLLFESFAQVVNDDRISEIVIVDDHSPYEIFTAISEHVRDIPKVKLYRNEKNLDCYRNKREAVSKATNEWVIILDSDNIINKEYVDKIYECNTEPYAWSEDTIYNPSFAKPHFDFRRFQMETYQGDINHYLQFSEFQTMLNAMNYFVNRDEYLRVWDGSVDPVTSDSIFQNYNWLKAGNSIYVVPGLEYEHRVHPGSHYQNNVRRTPRGFHDDIVNKLKALK